MSPCKCRRQHCNSKDEVLGCVQSLHEVACMLAVENFLSQEDFPNIKFAEKIRSRESPLLRNILSFLKLSCISVSTQTINLVIRSKKSSQFLYWCSSKLCVDVWSSWCPKLCQQWIDTTYAVSGVPVCVCVCVCAYPHVYILRENV